MQHHFPPQWDAYSILTVMVLVVFGLIAFALSIRCYPEDDDTPVGMKILFALLAACWNIVYVIYHLLAVYVVGVGC